jgi:hypothetical protein
MGFSILRACAAEIDQALEGFISHARGGEQAFACKARAQVRFIFLDAWVTQEEPR